MSGDEQGHASERGPVPAWFADVPVDGARTWLDWAEIASHALMAVAALAIVVLGVWLVSS